VAGVVSRWKVALAVVGAVAVTAGANAGVASWILQSRDKPTPVKDGPVSLPEELGWLPSSLPPEHKAPAGRAIALVWQYIDIEKYRFVTVGATTNTARVVPEIAERFRKPRTIPGSEPVTSPSARLSPDGTALAIGSDGTRTDGLVLLDLHTGERRSHSIGPGVIDIYAWSPDSTSVAYGNNDGLNILDTRSGRSEPVEFDSDGYYAAAFSPDGKHLAVDVDDAVFIVELNNNTDVPPRRIPKQTDEFLPTDVGWSVDGSQILLRRYTLPDGSPAGETHDGPVRARISFVDISRTSPKRLPATIDVEETYGVDVAGWRSPNELVLVDSSTDVTTVIVRTRGSTFAEVMLTGDASINEIQLPRALLRGLATRGGGNQDTYRAPSTTALTAQLLIGAAACYVLAVLLCLIAVFAVNARRAGAGRRSQ
jgi:hypothetical protein